MSVLFRYALLIFSFLFAWVNCFLLHELMHIKSQGLLMKGTIRVSKFGMTCVSDEVKNEKIYAYSGGIYSGIIYLIMSAFLFIYGIWEMYVPFSTVGVINVSYGVLEGMGYVSKRFILYVVVFIIMIILWFNYVNLYVL